MRVAQCRAQLCNQLAHLVGNSVVANQLGAQYKQADFSASSSGDILGQPETAHKMFALLADQLKTVMAGPNDQLFLEACVGGFDRVSHLDTGSLLQTSLS